MEKKNYKHEKKGHYNMQNPSATLPRQCCAWNPVEGRHWEGKKSNKSRKVNLVIKKIRVWERKYRAKKPDQNLWSLWEEEISLNSVLVLSTLANSEGK